MRLLLRACLLLEVEVAVACEEDEAVAEDGLRDRDGHDRQRGEREERAQALEQETVPPRRA